LAKLNNIKKSLKKLKKKIKVVDILKVIKEAKRKVAEESVSDPRNILRDEQMSKGLDAR